MPHNIRPADSAALPLPLLSLTTPSPSPPSTEPSLLRPLDLITPKHDVRTLTRRQVAFLVSKGHLLIIHRGLVYRMNRFLAAHPGGELAVLHYVGRDATDEIEAYHPLFALAKMKYYICAKIDSVDYNEATVGWKPLVPPLHLGWPGKAAAYEKIPSMDSTLALMDVYDSKGYPTAGAPEGSSLPFLSPEALEPAPPPPEICPLEQQRLSNSFRKLRWEMLQEPGLFDLNPLRLYQGHMLRCGLLFTSFACFYAYATTRWHLAASAVSLGFFMHQIMFVAHDAGHMELTGSRRVDYGIGGFIASYMSGLSLGWWVSQHDVHHMVTNHPEHDPDIQLLPFFAFNTVMFKSLYSTFHDCIMYYDAPARFLLEYQHLTFYPMMVVARFSLVGKSYYYLAMKAKPDAFRTYEVVGIVVWWCWFSKLVAHMGTGLEGWVNRVMFVLIMLVAVCPIHVQIVLSHSAQDSTDMGVYESFVARQFRTTMDIACPPYLDFIHGGLHMQLVHHLFPRLPRPNLRRATVIVKKWAKENNIEFLEKDFTAGRGQMLGMLEDIAGQARAFNAKVAELASGECEMEI